MAGLAGTQTIFGVNQTFAVPRSYVSTIKRNAKFQIRSIADQEGEKEQVLQEQASVPPSPPKPISPPKPKVNTKFFDLFAFSGPAPERINGRLAMLGFVAAIGAELASGQDLFVQLQSGGFPSFLGATALLTAASLIPMFKGVTVESKSEGVFTSSAELLNGRFAMMGLVALALTEFVKGSALV